VCKLCGEEFEPVIGRQGGRPRLHCYACVPVGWKIVRLPHRVKLRRVNPVGARTPKGGLGKLYRLPTA
jgi:hypothetical protein